MATLPTVADLGVSGVGVETNRGEELLEMEETAGDEDLPLLLTVQKSLLLM